MSGGEQFTRKDPPRHNNAWHYRKLGRNLPKLDSIVIALSQHLQERQQKQNQHSKSKHNTTVFIKI